MEASTLPGRLRAAAGRKGVRARLVHSLRWAGPLAYLVALGLVVGFRGLPTSRDALFFWILLGLLAASLTDVRRWARGIVVDWLPFGVILFSYDLLRGYADRFFSPYVRPQLRADELLFGTVPTVWLQRELWDGAASVDWIDYAAWSVYLTHFFATFVVAAALWLFAYRLFRPYVAAVSVLALAGFATYALFPAVPPWMASENGDLGPTERIVRDVSHQAPVGFFGSLWEHGSRYANDVAAVPSLHAAFAALIAIFLWPYVAPRWRPLLVAYPLAMAFALVYTAEHYVSDVLLGWLYAAGASAVGWLLVRRAGARA